ncbi:Spo0E like sporulation regulatory protein [Scopulibacillus darangshiensis]|uniref:Spo0E like sporulation regulatory protein n=1 Tax=Scopulibacillus darangshiensis TaxID=442528 RepID=A0A4R2P6M0_9BACL|nr:aspartyl-phosphate phosphatase Spo0E family protein [Scopulibacillus darangshiensis]TCP30550.1 Spo0E like sporulation regulatory protein [Scopulibacillus darangshiensis]
MHQTDIEKKRQQLINMVNQYGLTSTKALLCSQELDQLLQHYQQKKLKSMQSGKPCSPFINSAKT